MSRLNSKLVHLFLIIAAGLAIYLNTLQAPFFWDDSNVTLDTPQLKDLSSFLDPELSRQSFGRRYFGYLTFGLNYRLHGLDVFGYHLVNISIHLLAALLVYRLVSLTFRTPFLARREESSGPDARAGFIALLAALLFVVHPIQTQAVTYIVQRFASLATMLYLLSLTSYIRGRLALAGPTRRWLQGGAWFLAAAIAAALALKTKEIAFTLPIMIVLYEMTFFTGNFRKKLAALLLTPALLLAALATFSSVFSGRSLNEILVNLDRATRLQTDISRWDYLATQFRVVATYLRLLIFPVGQRIDYDFPLSQSFLEPAVLGSGLLLATLLALGCYHLWLSRSSAAEQAGLQRIVAFGIFWFFIALSIESSLIPIVDVIFEHRVYLPSVGAFLAVSAAVSLYCRSQERLAGWPDTRVLAAVGLATLLLAAATVSRNQLWRNEVAFWEDNAWKTPNKSRAMINLARAREKNGDPEGAMESYRKASELDPYNTDALLNRGLLYIQGGRYEEAIAEFKTALAIDPGLAEAHNNIGKVYGIQMKYPEALKEFEQAAAKQPALAEPHYNIGYIYLLQKRYQEAVQEFDKCLSRNPDHDQAYTNRGIALAATGRTSAAHADFRRALDIAPGNAEAARQLRLLQGNN